MRDLPVRLAAAIERALAAHARAERVAVLSGGYAPSALRHLGVSVPDLRGVVRRFSRETRSAGPREIIALALPLVKRRTVEGRQVGYELLARRADAMDRLTPALVGRLGRGNDNWASVDGFATFVAGRAWREGRLSDATVSGWARSSDRWWRRTALASTVALNVAARGGHGDAGRTLLVCRHFTGETDPMLARALSWALRSLVPHDPAAVRAFLERHGATLPAVVRREATAKLDTGRKRRATPRSSRGAGPGPPRATARPRPSTGAATPLPPAARPARAATASRRAPAPRARAPRAR
jgi:3-methyladenine DNA glycosylase AlkD